MRRFVRRLFAGLVVAALLLSLVLFVLTRRNLPGREGGRLPGLAAEVTVDFDDRGVATIHAASVEDALRAQGWLTARDRSFQLEVLRRRCGGKPRQTLRLLGAPPRPKASDLRLRASRRGRRPAAGAPRESRPGGSRFGDQLLLCRASGPPGSRVRAPRHGARPVAPFRLRRRPPPDVRAADGRRRGAAERREPRRTPRFPPRVPAPPRDGGRRPPRTRLPVARPAGPASGRRRPPSALPKAARRQAAEEVGVAGSNAFAVSGSLSASGRPILAGDPHLGLEMPAIWLPMRFVIAGRTSEGVTLPGLPALTIGRTDQVAWSFTNLEGDVQDLYRERIEGGRARRGTSSEPVVEDGDDPRSRRAGRGARRPLHVERAARRG